MSSKAKRLVLGLVILVAPLVSACNGKNDSNIIQAVVCSTQSKPSIVCPQQ